MSTKLHIAPGFSLPLDAVTQTFAVLAKKGSGKTYTASVLAEEMLAAGQRIVAIDPTGAWWGLRSTADGKGEGYGVMVFGGDHGDVPINPNSGEVVAQAIVEGGISAVLDLSLLRKGESIRFVTAFMETLYRLNRNPLHLFIDEADDLCPQRMQGDEARMVGAVEDVVKRGRKKGIGCTLITQRPADLNKQVLTQCEVLIALNISHPKDIAPINDWVRVHADDTEAKKMIADLPTLPRGEAWIWSPSWLAVFERIKIRTRKTFDSGATPTVGAKVAQPKKLAPVDVQALGAKIAELAESAAANDPAKLKARVAKLESELKKAEGKVAVPLKPEPTAEEAAMKKSAQKVLVVARDLILVLKDATAQLESLVADNRPLDQDRGGVPKITAFFAPPKPLAAHRPGKSATSSPPIRQVDPHGVKLGKAERKILEAALQRPGLPKETIAVMCGYSSTGGGFNNSLSKLRSTGLIVPGEKIDITDAGRQLLGDDWTPLPSGMAALDYWMGHSEVGKAERAVLELIRDNFPHSIPKAEIAERTGYAASGGGFNNALSKLRTLKLITGGDPIGPSVELQDAVGGGK